MDRQDKIITITMIALTGVISLLALPQTTTHIAAKSVAEVTQPLAATTSPFDSISLQAKAAYVLDLSSNKVLYAKNENDRLPLASLTKLMTTVTAMELAPNDQVTVTIDPESLNQDGDNGLYLNERWSLNSILQFMLVASSNDAASAVATSLGALASPLGSTNPVSAFVEAMNTKAHDLGFSTLEFSNPNGLDLSPTEAGAYGSAADVAHLLAYANQRDRSILEDTRYPSIKVSSIDGFSHTVQNTDEIALEIPSLIAGKTGYTTLAGGNLAVIFDAGFQHPMAVVVLGSTYEGRFSDVKALVDASIKSVSQP